MKEKTKRVGFIYNKQFVKSKGEETCGTVMDLFNEMYCRGKQGIVGAAKEMQ